MNYIQKVFEVVKKIPKGKVMTYGQVGKISGVNPRMVGWALNSNRSSEVPCHRVVDIEGRLAPNFAFDGWREQKRRLLAEGIEFLDEMHVDLDKFLYEEKSKG